MHDIHTIFVWRLISSADINKATSSGECFYKINEKDDFSDGPAMKNIACLVYFSYSESHWSKHSD